VLAGCDALVTNDTGPMHLAAALGTPVVALEGPADVRQTRPLGARVRLIGRFDLPCVPCVKNRCPRTGPGTELTDARNECMWLISVDEVERAAQELLEGSRPGE
jgi:ADP-heptose:LPS heptosyltransferase